MRNTGGSPKVKLLLVDAQEENLTSLEALLLRDDVELHTARSSKEALDLVLEHDFTLALLDVRLPEMDGFMLAERMRGSERSQTIPIIFATADGRDLSRVFHRYDAGAVDFLFKPIDPRILEHKVETFIARSRQRQQLAETVRLNESFMAAVGHDLRNPLNVMMMAAQGIDASAEDASTRGLAQKINVHGRRMARMIDELFDLARGRVRCGVPLVRRHFDFGALLHRVIGSHAALHPGRVIWFEDRARNSGDWEEGRIEQLVDNLVGNAMQHGSPDEPVTVRIGDEPRHMRFTIHNGGVIAEALVPHLFDSVQTSQDGTKRAEGLGLGLHIVDRITCSHGGTIEVRSDAAYGTTFEVKLPLEPPPS